MLRWWSPESSKQHEFPRFGVPPRSTMIFRSYMNPVVIHTTREPGGIPLTRVCPGCQILVHNYCYFPPKQIINRNRHQSVICNLKSDLCYRVEWIWIVLQTAKTLKQWVPRLQHRSAMRFADAGPHLLLRCHGSAHRASEPSVYRLCSRPYQSLRPYGPRRRALRHS